MAVSTAILTRVKSDTRHDAEVTPMKNGRYRAECPCGWWRDHLIPNQAIRSMRIHQEGEPCEACYDWLIDHHPDHYESLDLYLEWAQRAHRKHL